MAAADTLAALLRQRRTALGATLADIRARGRLKSCASLNRWERATLPQEEKLPAIAMAYGLPLESVVDAWITARAARGTP